MQGAQPRVSGRAGITASPPGSGLGGALGEGGGGRLVHLTDEAGEAAIGASKRLTGKHGIFAIPEEVAERAGTLERFARTGLDPRKTTQLVKIPEGAVAEFQRPWAIGPYSAWKRFGGVRFARPGSILMPGSAEGAAGTLIPSSTLLGPRLSIYGTDALIYATVGAYAYYLSQQDSQPKAPIQPPQGPK